MQNVRARRGRAGWPARTALGCALLLGAPFGPAAAGALPDSEAAGAAGAQAIARGEAAADAAQALVREGLAAQDRFDPKTALQCFLKAAALKPNDGFILREISKQYSDCTLGSQDQDLNRRCIEEALAYTKKALAVEPKNPVAVLSLAVCYGKLGLYSDVRDRIGYARMIKQYADEAIALDPNYAYAHHVLGRWNYEVASLGRTKRFLVKLIYGGLPDASYEEAVRQLETATRLDPQIVAHRLELGFAYLNAGRDADARACFRQVLTMPKREIYDDECRSRAEAALGRLEAGK